jgi:two-component sensor histidine kinase
MQEVHHRVKNSLQMVRSVLSLQARTLTSHEAKGHLEDAAARVMAIAAVHHRLHDGPSVTASDARDISVACSTT